MVEWVAIVTSLALIQVFVFAILVGKARVDYGIDAPTTTGSPEFERAFRVHQNTIEQLIIFIPSLWMFAYFVRPDIAAGIGVVYLIGRQIYRGSYIGDPAKRSAGFGMTALSSIVLLLGGLIGAVLNLV
jgi:glutathione S-transferase